MWSSMPAATRIRRRVVPCTRTARWSRLSFGSLCSGRVRGAWSRGSLEARGEALVCQQVGLDRGVEAVDQRFDLVRGGSQHALVNDTSRREVTRNLEPGRRLRHQSRRFVG